jgi:hypothetical protein
MFKLAVERVKFRNVLGLNGWDFHIAYVNRIADMAIVKSAEG